MLDKYQYSWRGVWAGMRNISILKNRKLNRMGVHGGWLFTGRDAAWPSAAPPRGGNWLPGLVVPSAAAMPKGVPPHGEGTVHLLCEETSQTGPGSYKQTTLNLKIYFSLHLHPKEGCSYSCCPIWEAMGEQDKPPAEAVALQAAVLHWARLTLLPVCIIPSPMNSQLNLKRIKIESEFWMQPNIL